MHENQAVYIAGTSAAGVIFPSALRTVAAYNSAEMVNSYNTGIRLFVVNDGGAGTSTATVKIQVRASGSSTWIDLAGAATAALGVTTGSIITIYPGLTGIADSAGVTINQHLGLIWRAVLTVGTVDGTSAVFGDYLA